MTYNSDKIKADYFTFDGALGKAEFLNSFLILFVISLVTWGILDLLMFPAILVFLFAIIRIIIAVAMFSITIRRLHDIGFSGWLSLLLFIPLVNLAFIIYLCVADTGSGKGTV